MPFCPTIKAESPHPIRPSNCEPIEFSERERLNIRMPTMKKSLATLTFTALAFSATVIPGLNEQTLGQRRKQTQFISRISGAGCEPRRARPDLSHGRHGH